MRKTFLILFATLAFHSLFANVGVKPKYKFSKATLHVLRKDLDPKTLDALDAYEEAVQLEKEISEIYKEVKATKLSIIQRQLLEKSLKDTLAPVSKRLKIDRVELQRERVDAEDVGKYKEELKEIMFETDNIVANAKKMLDELLDPPQEEIPEIEIKQEEEKEEVKQLQEEEQSLEQVKEALKKMDEEIKEVVESTKNAEKIVEKKKVEKAEIEKRTKESKTKAEKVAKDITSKLKDETLIEKDTLEKIEKELKKTLEELVKAEKAYDKKIKKEKEEKKKTEEQVKKEEKKKTKPEDLLKDTPEEKAEDLKKEIVKTQDAREEIVKAILKVKEIEKIIKEAQISCGTMAKIEKKDEKIEKIQALQLLSMENQGKYVDLSQQMRGVGLNKPITNVPQEDIPPSIQHFEGHYGNKIVTTGGKGAIWFYLDKWHIIGPFDNAGRKNIETVFPPQSMVDLNATYTGKNGEFLKWNYDTFNDRMIYPPGYSEYAIYYAYTELYSDEDRDVWITVGSDDRSDIWVNELPVWRSSNQLKSWSIDEGYRKIYLKKGINKILYRIENGHYALGFSLLVNIYNPKDKSRLNDLLNKKLQRKTKKKK